MLEMYEILLENDEQGVQAISLVENPAIEEDFIALNSQQVMLASVDEEKRIVVGAVLVPNKPIYRNDGNKEYYIYFGEDTIRKTAEKYMYDKNTSNATLEHESKVDDVHLMESWLVEHETYDKSKKYGLDLSVGTWAATMKINNEEIWQKIKNRELKGFSIEGVFSNMLVQQSAQPNEWDIALEQLKMAIKAAL